jgi:hypothetical protein
VSFDQRADDPDGAAELGPEIRGLLDPYVPPPDPYLRVAARIRERRDRRRALACLAATVTAVAAMAFTTSGLAARRGNVRPVDPAAVAPVEQATDAQFAAFGGNSPLGAAFVIARGTANGRPYAIASVGFGRSGQTCMYADDAVFAQLSQCFMAKPGQVGTWAPLNQVRTATGVVAIGGIVDMEVTRLTARLADGQRLPLTAVQTPTSADVAFFALVLPQGARIAAVTAADEIGGSVPLPQDGPDECTASAPCGSGRPPFPDRAVRDDRTPVPARGASGASAGSVPM